MTEFRELLEREGERFDLPPGGLDRLRGKHHRRLRNRRLATGVLALTLASGGTLLAVRMLQDVGPAPLPADEIRVVDTFSVGSRPAAAAVGEGALWIASLVDRTVLRIDPATGEEVERITTPSDLGPPVDVTVAIGSVWVRTGWLGPPMGEREGRLPAVLRLDPATNRVVATFALEHDEAARIAVGGGALWSANTLTYTVSRHALDNGEVTATVRGSQWPVALAFGEGAVWDLGEGRPDVTPPVPGTLARIDPRSASVTALVDVGIRPRDLAVGEGAVWVLSSADGTIHRVDPTTVEVESSIPVPGRPTQVEVGAGGVWVLDGGGGTLYRIDPDDRRITGSVDVGEGPVAMATDRDHVWVARIDGTILRVEG